MLRCACAIARLPHPHKQLLFALLSLTDLALTWFLIEHGGGQFYESNPLAAWCLRGHGWAGLAAFKAGTVLVVAALAIVIGRRRPVVAGRLLAVGCTAVAGVLLYSVYLGVVSAPSLASLREAEEEGAQMERYVVGVHAYSRRRELLVGDLARGRVRLAEAVAELESAARRRKARLPARLRDRDRPLLDRASVALSLMSSAVLLLADKPEAARRLGQRLDAAYRAQFGSGPPERFRGLLARIDPLPVRQARRPVRHEREACGPSVPDGTSMSLLPARPCLALPFTVLPGHDQVSLVAGEEFRFTLAGPGLETWLPAWLERLDGRRSLEEILGDLAPAHHAAARQVLVRLAGERVLVEGPVALAALPGPAGLVVEGSGVIRAALEALGAASAGVRVLCQDRLDVDECLRFNASCLGGQTPWLWVSCAALSRGYVSPVFLPDAGPCLACLVGHFRRLSPLPELYDELAAHVQGGGELAAAPFPVPGVEILARLVRWKVDLAGRAAAFRLHVLEAGTLEVSSHRVLLDPECPACRGRR